MATQHKQYVADVADPGIFARAPIPGKADIPRRRTASKPPTQKQIYITSDIRKTEEPIEIVVKHINSLPNWALPMGSAMLAVFLLLLACSLVVIPAFTALQDQ